MLDLVEIDDIYPLSRGKSGKKRGKKFSKVEDVMKPYIEWLKEELEFEEKQPSGGENDGCIYMSIDKTRERLGDTYKYHTDLAIYRALRHILLKYNIILKLDTQTDKKKVFKMTRQVGVVQSNVVLV